ncbi:MAG: hypothetical protein C0403_19005, partial [Desulfobacterium sp.]|nr:hypothetical protein [Desulfobacterium sp.]
MEKQQNFLAPAVEWRKFLKKQNNKYSRVFAIIRDSSLETTTMMFAGVFVFSLLLLTWMEQGAFRLASDDSYIYLGYVKMLLRQGELFSYNIGETSAGTTGLMYYYLLSLIAFVFHSIFSPDVIGNLLTATTYATNTVLFLVYATLFIMIWKRMGQGIENSGSTFTGVLLFAITLMGIPFLWGFFSGLENPLTTCLILYLFFLFLKQSHWSIISLICACLVTTRPELLPIGGLLSVCGGFCFHDPEKHGSQQIKSQLWAVTRSILLFGLVALIVIAPCWYLTGSPLPSSLGARVTIPALKDPGILLKNIWDLMLSPDYLMNPWVAGSLICLVIVFAARKTPKGGVILGSGIFLVLFFMM